MRTLSKCYDAAGRKIPVFYKTVAHSASADLACHVASVIGAESVAHDKARFVALYPAISVILIIISASLSADFRINELHIFRISLLDRGLVRCTSSMQIITQVSSEIKRGRKAGVKICVTVIFV